MGEFLAFRRMAMPFVVQGIFWFGFSYLALIGIISPILVKLEIYGLTEWLWRNDFWLPPDPSSLLEGGIAFVFGVVVLRLYSELMIVIFRIFGALMDIRQALRSTGQTFNPAAASYVAPPSAHQQPTMPFPPQYGQPVAQAPGAGFNANFPPQG